ncbi:MAG: LamG-like jellyroll fold domain-containing protein [bacterium]
MNITQPHKTPPTFVKGPALTLTALGVGTGHHLKWAARAAFGIMAVLPARADYSNTVATFNPLGYWHLNETASVVEDATAYNTGSGPGLNGSFLNDPAKGVTPALAGPSGTAVSFNGTSQYIDIPYSTQLNTTVFSAEIWANPASLSQPSGTAAVMSSGQPAAANRTGWVLYLFGTVWSFRPFTNNGNLTVTGDGNGINSADGTAVAGAWHHLVVVNDGTKCKLYVNGALANEIEPLPANAYVAATSGGTILGKRYDALNHFYGTLDEAAFYTAALSAQDVLDHYNNGRDAGRTTPYATLVGTSHPVGYYRLDEPAFVAPTAVNSGSLGAAANGGYGLGTITAAAGPPFSGLGAGNTACRFNGSGQIACGNSTGFDVSEISVAAWIKPSGVYQDMSVLGKGSSLWLLQMDGRRSQLRWVCSGIANIGAKNVTDGVWHHVVAVAGSSGSALYVDGALEASDPTPVTLSATTNQVTIGSGGIARWFGSIDEVSIFGSALTAQNVADLYLAAHPPANDIYSFGPGAVISGTNITWTLPLGTDVTSLSPTFAMSFQATCNKTSGALQDFASPVHYFVTNSAGTSVKDYLVTVVLDKVPVIAGLACWYDASAGVTTDGTGVLTWNDRSGNGHVATRSSGAPSLVPDDINSKSSVHLRGGSCYLDCAGPMFVKEQYVVVRSPNTNWNGEGSFLARASTVFLSVRQSSHNLFKNQTGFWDDQLPSAVSMNGAAVSNTPVTMPRGGFELGTITNYMLLKVTVNDAATPENLATYPYNQIGRTETLTSCDMDIAEIIGYGTTNTFSDEVKIGNYLAEKYGISTAYPPIPPGGLVATSGVGQIGLNWTAVFGATGYDIKRSTTSGSGYTTVGTTDGTAYTDSSVKAGPTYFYVVTATNSITTSANSAEVSAKAKPLGTMFMIR